MALAFKTPGVYVQEIAKLPPSIAEVATAVPVFIGYTEKAVGANGGSISLVPTKISSLLEYEQLFGGSNASITVELDSENVISDISVSDGSLKYVMYYSVQMYFKNGGAPCYIVSVSEYKDSAPYVKKNELKTGLESIFKEDEITLIVFPDITCISGTTTTCVANMCEVYKEALIQCNKLQDRFVIMDVIHSLSSNSIADFRTNIGTQHLKYGAAYYPRLVSTLKYQYTDDKVVFSQSSGSTDINTKTLAEVLEAIEDGLGTAYEPFVTNEFVTIIRDSILDQTGNLMLPTSPIMAGIYASVDRDRGVWKAPANVSISNVIGPEIKLTDEDQELLNVDTTAGKSINAIRAFIGKGTLVWGSRTLAGNDNEWRYVPVRRLFITVEESVKKSTSWAVFEPNDANTWVRIKAQIENYLTGLWKNGALAGATPDEAFFVAVGLGSTMTADDILNGYMNIEIGMAAVRPAEFIVLKFSHKLQTS